MAVVGVQWRVRCGSVPLRGLWSGEFIFFSSYALSGLVLPFFFTLLETYGLQLHHLSPDSITLVAIFIHPCEMYVSVRPLVRLFRLFHVLHSFRKRVSPIGGYYFQHRTKGPAVYITALTPGKWDQWRDDWVIMQVEVNDRLELLTATPTGSHSGWERVPNLQPAYHVVLRRIQFLTENGLTSVMMLFDFLSKCIAPLQLRARPAWLYTRENDATRLECGRGSDLDLTILNGRLSKLSVNPSSGDFINPLAPCMPICLDQVVRLLLLKAHTGQY
jgi:hypothetical protein